MKKNIEIFIHEVHNIYTNVVDPSYYFYNSVVTSCIFRERMVVGFTTIYAISVYHHYNLWIRTLFMARWTRYDIMW